MWGLLLWRADRLWPAVPRQRAPQGPDPPAGAAAFDSPHCALDQRAHGALGVPSTSLPPAPPARHAGLSRGWRRCSQPSARGSSSCCPCRGCRSSAALLGPRPSQGGQRSATAGDVGSCRPGDCEQRFKCAEGRRMRGACSAGGRMTVVGQAAKVAAHATEGGRTLREGRLFCAAVRRFWWDDWEFWCVPWLLAAAMDDAGPVCEVIAVGDEFKVANVALYFAPHPSFRPGGLPARPPPRDAPTLETVTLRFPGCGVGRRAGARGLSAAHRGGGGGGVRRCHA